MHTHELSLTLFGGFLLSAGQGQEIAVPTRKSRGLLAYLTLNSHHGITRDHLVDLLWRDRSERQARHSLSQSLSELRGAVNDTGAPVLKANRDRVWLETDLIFVDVLSFERAVAGEPIDKLEEAATLYNGALLADFGELDPGFDEWRTVRQTELEVQVRHVYGRLLAQSDGSNERRIELAQSLLGLDPYNELAYRVLMETHAKRGYLDIAHHQFEVCKDLLHRDLGVEPDAQTLALKEKISKREGRSKAHLVELMPSAAMATSTNRTNLNSVVEPPALVLPDKPSIAVLPFTNMSGDPEQEYFVDGVTEEIITGLGHFREIIVVAWGSSFLFKNQSVDAVEAAGKLGVGYVLEGNVRKAGARVRITTQLTDGKTGHQLWAERYDRALEDIFAVQDDVSQKIVTMLADRLEEDSLERALQKNTTNLSAYDYWLRGKHYLGDWKGSNDDVLRARDMFERAIEIDPEYAAAYAGLAGTYIMEFENDWTTTPEVTGARGLELARKAVSLDPRDSSTHLMLAAAYRDVKSNFEMADAQIRTAIELNPNHYWNYCVRSWLSICAGDLEEGISYGVEAIRRNPLLPDHCLCSMAVAEYLAGRYERGIETLGKISNPDIQSQVCFAACYARLGRDDEARTLAEDVRNLLSKEFNNPPTQDEESWRQYLMMLFPFKESKNFELLFEGFRKAGLP